MVDAPRIYVACLAAYNNGVLHGKWIDVDTDLETLQEEIGKVIATSPVKGAEEYAIHDTEGFGPVEVGEYPSLKHVVALADALQTYGRRDNQSDAFLAYLDYIGGLAQIDDAVEKFDEAYLGEYDDLASYAEQLYDDLGTEIPEAFKYYIDWKKLGRDMELGSDVFTVDAGGGKVWVFDNHV